MNRTLISNLRKKIGKKVLVQGWVQDVRNLSKIKFIIVRDRSGTIQAVALQSETKEKTFNLINELTPESVVTITGKVQENKESRWGIEVLIRKVTVVSAAAVPLPIDNSDKSTTHIDKRLDYRFLDTRNPKHLAIFKIRSKIARILTDFFDKKGFINVNTPKLTTIGVESGAELFNVNYFGRPVYLSQSPQVYKQMFVAGGFERVYEIAPIFRAEKSNTTRHLTEFTGIDMEMGFIKDEQDIMDLIESMLMYLLKTLGKEASTELKLRGITHTIPKNIPRIPMQEVKAMLAGKGKNYRPEEDLDAEGERLLGQLVKEKYGSEFVFVTRFPWAVRPFYHMKPEDDQNATKSFDLLFNGVEIATGAQREHRYELLKAQAAEKGLDLHSMTKYAEIFRYGIPPHGGVGFGLDRITQRLLNLDNVREAVLLPRDPERSSP